MQWVLYHPPKKFAWFIHCYVDVFGFAQIELSLSCCKLQIVFNITKYQILFVLQIVFQKKLTSGVVYKFHCGLCNESCYGECVRHLNLRIRKHIAIATLTKKKSKISALGDHFLLCNLSPSVDSFSLLTKENRKFAFELKESLR